MKGNKMSAILAILLLSSVFAAIPLAHAAVPADSVEISESPIVWQYPIHAPGEQFVFHIHVTNVVGLFSFQCGFYFDQNYLQIIKVEEGGFLTHNGADAVSPYPGTINNAIGKVTAFGYVLQDPANSKTGSGYLLNVTAKIKPGLWPPYTDTAPGGPVVLADLSVTDLQTQLILMYQDGKTKITPPADHVYDGSFTLFVVPANPIAAFTWTPTPSYDNEVVTFDPSTSTDGWNGYAWIAITDLAWDWGDGSLVQHTADKTVTVPHTFSWVPPPDIMTYTVTLTVTDADGRVSAPTSHDVIVIVRPSGPVIDLESQRWRYEDPTLVQDPFFGEGPHFPCDLFRPGELVMLWALVTYNGDPVQDQLVAFEVHDNHDNIVLTGSARSDANGWAEYEFRIPWPCTGPEPEFGTWSAIAKWSVGTMAGKPYMKTFNDTMSWLVGWGIWIKETQECDAQGNTKTSFYKSEMVYVKIHIQNDYMMARLATITAVIYDDLMVPINTPAILVDYNLMPGQSYILMVGIHVEKWAYVGTGTAKVNAFTKLPFLCGTSWCPEETETFIIKKTPGEIPPPDP